MADAPLTRPPSQETALLDQIARLDRLRSGRVALQIRLSLLSQTYKRNDYIRVATELFTSNAKTFDGQIFTMQNSDIIFIAKDTTNTLLDAMVARVRNLFKDDPLVQSGDEGSGTGLCTWFDLETQFDAFNDVAQNYMNLAERARLAATGLIAGERVDPLAPVHPDLLAKLEQSLNQTDITNVVRRQTVCTVFEGQPPQVLFEELFVSIEDLQKVATPGIDLKANRWLFQHLTQALDRRMLMKLMRDGPKTERPFSLNLNLATILSPEFFRFQEIIAPQLRGRLVIEINKVDVFADMSAFLFARDYLRDLGFRVCLDGLTYHTLAYYDRSKLGFDLLKIFWTPDSIDAMPDHMIPQIRNIVMDAGQARAILCRCDNERAIEVGQRLGIVMFEGRYVESLLAEGKK
jgi:EAL domain-containing protein (putative c-di-GMP-specific phosphodiesterase class I)